MNSTLVLVAIILLIILLIIYYIKKEKIPSNETAGETAGKNTGDFIANTAIALVNKTGEALGIGAKKEGETCASHANCEGWLAATPGKLACCSGTCKKMQRDWAGVGYCPEVCQDAPSPLGKKGSCGSGHSWKRKENEPCDTHAACDGWIAARAGRLACCYGTCKPMVKGFAGLGFCPK